MDLLKFMDEDRNHMISPAIIKATLAMVFEGARGRSAAEIAAVFDITSDLSSLRNKLQRLLYSTNSDSTTTVMEEANAVFISDAYQTIPEFKKILKNYYRASVNHINFANGQTTAALINRWVTEATRNRISERIEPGDISADAALILVNALYFKGEWAEGFDEKYTSLKCFHNSRSICKKTKMMTALRIYKYKVFNELDAQAVQLPYDGGEYAMLVIVPNENNNVERLISDLTRFHISNVLNKLEPVEVIVSLPRFDIQYAADLVDEFQKLGIRDVFGNRANLSGMVQEEHVKINNIMHIAGVEVNERGAVSTVTSIDLIPITGMELPRLYANRPFLFFIHHVPTNIIILEGRFNEPVDAYTEIFGKRPFLPTQAEPL